MLDLRTSLLLDGINEYCKEGSYKIIEREELLACFPPMLKADEDSLEQCLDRLEEKKLIDLRYREQGLYCLCPLPEGREYSERANRICAENKADKRSRTFSVLLSSFFGSAFGCFFALGVLLLIGRGRL